MSLFINSKLKEIVKNPVNPTMFYKIYSTILHDFFNFLPHLWFIAVNLTVFTLGLWVERAIVKAF